VGSFAYTEGDKAVEHETNGVPPLLHIHVCQHCDSPFRRKEGAGRVHTTGFFICPRCGKEGPLNIEIREIKESESATSTT